MDANQVLKELTAIPEQHSWVASVFLNTRRSDEHQREAVRIFVQEESRKALRSVSDEQRPELARSLGAVEEYLTGLIRHRYDQWVAGLALFSSEPIRLFRVLRTRVPFEPMELFLDKRPRVVPLVRTCAKAPHLLVAAVDSEGAHLFDVSCSGVDGETRIERPLPGRHGETGWTYRRWERHLDVERERNFRVMAEMLVKAADLAPDALLVLAGQNVVVKELEGYLHERVRSRVAARLPFPAGVTEGELRDSLLRSAAPHVMRALSGRIAAEKDRVLADAAGVGPGAVGVPAVLLALSEGTVHKLFVDSNYRARGWRCESCGALLERPPEGGCVYCGGTPVAVDFPEEVIRRAVLEDAQIAFLPPEVSLGPQVGLAAQLRHRNHVS